MATRKPTKIVGQDGLVTIFTPYPRHRPWTVQLWDIDELPNLERIVAALNLSAADADKTGTQDAWAYLHRLVAAFREKWKSYSDMRDVPNLKDRLQPQDWERLNAVAEGMRIQMLPDGTLIVLYKHYDEPACRFLNLLRSSQETWGRLGGPCRSCQKWFVRKTLKPSTCCSRKCAGNVAKIQQRQRQRQCLLARVKMAISKFEALPPRHRARRSDWREFVIETARVSSKFLAQLLNRNEVRPPEDRHEHS